jgi:hypothetical protein
MHLYQWSCFFLAATSVLCFLGLAIDAFHAGRTLPTGVWPRHNLGECLGMLLLMIGCASRVSDVWNRESVPADWFMVHAGIGCFFIFNAFKHFVRMRPALFRRWIEFFVRTSPHAIDSNVQWGLFNRLHGRTAVVPPERRHKV